MAQNVFTLDDDVETTRSYYAFKGITENLKPGDQIPVRKEVDEWYKSDDPEDRMQVYVFLMGLDRFLSQPPTLYDGQPARLSYFQIAGIHGYPKIP